MDKNNIDNIVNNIYNNDNHDLQCLDIKENIFTDNYKETESDIDTSWIDNRLYNSLNIPEKEIMNSIGLYFIYINKNFYIEKILYEKQILEKKIEQCFLSKETVLKIIQSKKITTPNSKYKLIDILSFIIDNDYDDIKDLNNITLKNIPIFDDILINKSIFIFHNINTIYFIFKEYENSIQYRTTLKSILKNTASPKKEDLNITKKVKIFISPKEYYKKNNNFTKKNRNYD
jgi:hypothetical protein